MQTPLKPFLIAGLALSCTVALAQSGPPGNASIQTRPADLPVAYDVVSVRPHKEDKSGVGSHWQSNPAGFSANVPLRSLITSAYNVIMPDQISGLPGWADTENFDVEAKLDPENAEALGKLHDDERRNQHAILMKALLADRFKMRAHVEVRELPVYNLVIAKTGLKMKEASPDQPSGYGMGMGTIKSEGMPVGGLVASLSHPVGRLIIDKTGLTGKYQVNLTWAWNDDPNSSAPSLFTALQEQLGLKLEPAKAPEDVVVIDHVERPSEN